MWSLIESELRTVLCPIMFSVLLVLLGMLLRRRIADQPLYAFTAACAFLLLADGLDSLWAGFFLPVEVITSACSTALLMISALKPKRATCALIGSGFLIGYFAFILTIGFHDLELAFVGIVFAPNKVVLWITELFLFVLLPVALAAGVLSLARALRACRHKPAHIPALPTA